MSWLDIAARLLLAGLLFAAAWALTRIADTRDKRRRAERAEIIARATARRAHPSTVGRRAGLGESDR